MPETDLAVTLFFAMGEHGSVTTEVEELSANIANTTGRLNDAQARTREIQRQLGVVPSSRPRSGRLKVVPHEQAPELNWDDVLGRARRSMDDSTHTIDDLLTDKELASIDRRLVDGFTVRSRLDRYDIVAAVAAGITAALLDYLVVAVPRESGLTQTLRSLGTNNDNWLSGIAKVPYDTVFPEGMSGFGPNAHRVQTFGHDPLLGWVYGTMDILRGSLTGVSKTGAVRVLGGGVPTAETLPAALAIQAMHLISDIVTPAGLQLPGWTALLTIDQTALGSKDTVAEITRMMYVRGYDTWHLPTMAGPVLSIEAVVRGYLGLRQVLDPDYCEELDIERLRSGSNRVADLPRYEVMMLIAQAIAVAGNGGRFALSGANPLTLNFPLWMAFAKSFLGSLDRGRSSDTMIDAANMNRLVLDAGWASVEIDRDALPTISYDPASSNLGIHP